LSKEATRALFVRHSKAETHHIEGGEVTKVLAAGRDTDGRVSVFESELPAGNEAPWHFHERDDEIFYIISGEVEFGVDDGEFVATSGDLVIAGPHVRRRFKALTDSRFLVINAPGGPSEGFIREIAQFKGGARPTPEDRQRFITEFGIHILPPPE